jgi:hypothetical protein
VNLLRKLTALWDQHQDAAVIGAGALALVLVAVVAWRIWHSAERSKILDRLTAVVVMAWTSEGLVHVALSTFKLPAAFVAITFFVFEAMMLSAGMKAEEYRRRRGVPGPAGRYVFLIAAVSGVVSSFGAGSAGEVFLRIVLPPLAVGLWWISLLMDRADDTEEIKAARTRAAEEREATWVHTPRSVAVRLGLMKPGRSTTTEAQREAQIRRMVELADAADGRTGKARARRLARLRRLTRTADEAMVVEVAERVERARDSERRMLPDRAGLTGQADRAGAGQPTGQQAAGQVPDLTGQTEGAARANGNGHPGGQADKLTDDEIMDRFGPGLVAVARDRPDRRVGREVVAKTCKIGSSRAERIMARVNALAAEEVPDRG